MKFIITVDTEGDNQWSKEKKITTENLKFLPRFQRLCERYGFIPTYLLSYEVTQDETAVKILSDWQGLKKAEIGAHLHPWVMSDYKGEGQAYPSELTDHDLKQQLEMLTWAIEEKFNNRPTSYRAGRWGFNERQAKILKNLGYLVDCSITPKINWAKTLGLIGGQGGPDFRFSQVMPYYIFDGLLEIPMTILFTGILKKEKNACANFFLGLTNGFLKKILNKILFRQKWLRIFPGSGEGDWINIYKSAKLNKLPCLEFMIHSSELMPGGSPYAKDEAAVELIYDQLEKMFNYFNSQGLAGASLSEFARDYKNY
ncbi:MAG: hypothetical protein WCV69_02375 [Patescibacteria group bacterium]|jgi:hypothetical protein